MKKLALYLLLLVVFSAYAYAEICKSSPVVYYGYCEPLGDLAVYDGSGSLIEEQAYSLTSGCTKNIYRVVVSGGPGCAVEEGDSLVFKISGKIAGAAVWRQSASSVFLNISTTGRIFVSVNEDETTSNVTVEDEEGVDIEKFGTSSGGGSAAQKTVSIKQPVDGGEIELIKFNTSLEENRVIDFRLDQNGLFVNLGATNYSEILVPALKKSGALYVCLASENMDCDKIVLEMGQQVQGLYLEPGYRTIFDKKYYVLHGLTFGSVQEVDRPQWMMPAILAAAALVIVFVLVIKHKYSKKKKK